MTKQSETYGPKEAARRRDKGLIGKFTSRFYSSNHEAGGHALSLDAPMYDGRSWYDVLPDPSTIGVT